MTLVVCRIEGDDIFIQSDTMLTDLFSAGVERHLRQKIPLAGTLKTVFLHRHVSLSFAGQSVYATNFLKHFMSTSLSEWTTDRLITELDEIHRSSQNECEFLVCTAFDRKPAIITIKDGVITKGSLTGWIGSVDGFEAFQHSFHASAKTMLHERMAEAFRAVIDDENIAEVGHFHIQAYLEHHALDESDDSLFMYEWKHESDAGNEAQNIKPLERTALTMGSAASGAYGTSYFRSLSAEKHGVAIHFPHAAFGVFWCPQVDCEKAIVINRCGASKFLQILWERYEVPLEGMGLDGDRLRFIRNYQKVG